MGLPGMGLGASLQRTLSDRILTDCTLKYGVDKLTHINVIGDRYDKANSAPLKVLREYRYS